MKKYRDYYFKKAKKEDYRARSVFKLKDMDKKFGLLSRGMKVLDLGCAPGSWLQYCSERVGKGGKVVGVDLTEVKKLPAGVRVIKEDIFSMAPDDFDEAPFDCVLSDMAPSTTGAKLADHFRSVELCRAAFALASGVLRPGGSFVFKIFQGKDFPDFLKEVKAGFKKVKIFKPPSSRPESREIFVVCQNKL